MRRESGLSLITVLLCQCRGNKVRSLRLRSDGRRTTVWRLQRWPTFSALPASVFVLVVILCYLGSFCPGDMGSPSSAALMQSEREREFRVGVVRFLQSVYIIGSPNAIDRSIDRSTVDAKGEKEDGHGDWENNNIHLHRMRSPPSHRQQPRTLGHPVRKSPPVRPHVRTAVCPRRPPTSRGAARCAPKSDKVAAFAPPRPPNVFL